MSAILPVLHLLMPRFISVFLNTHLLTVFGVSTLSLQEIQSAAGLSGRMKGAGGVGGRWQQQGQSNGPPLPPGGQ